MPGGIPAAAFAIGKPGATNTALFTAAILAGYRWKNPRRAAQTAAVLAAELP